MCESLGSPKVLLSACRYTCTQTFVALAANCLQPLSRANLQPTKKQCFVAWASRSKRADVFEGATVWWVLVAPLLFHLVAILIVHFPSAGIVTVCALLVL